MIAVDTNLLVYAHHPEMAFHERARQVLAEAVTAPEPVYVPWLCAHEFLAVVSNPRIFRDPTPVDVVLDAIRRLLASLSGGFLAEGEGNMLSEGRSIATIFEGKSVIAPPRGTREARNAFVAFDMLPQWDPAREADPFCAHETLMAGLLDFCGRCRRTGAVHHIAPPADRVSGAMANLLSWLGGTNEYLLIASSVFHREFEFIHPFEDGKGRMGCLWQTLFLTRRNPFFASIPAESIVHARQGDCYTVIQEGSARGRAPRSSSSCWRQSSKPSRPPKKSLKKPLKYATCFLSSGERCRRATSWNCWT